MRLATLRSGGSLFQSLEQTWTIEWAASDDPDSSSEVAGSEVFTWEADLGGWRAAMNKPAEESFMDTSVSDFYCSGVGGVYSIQVQGYPVPDAWVKTAISAWGLTKSGTGDGYDLYPASTQFDNGTHTMVINGNTYSFTRQNAVYVCLKTTTEDYGAIYINEMRIVANGASWISDLCGANPSNWANTVLSFQLKGS